MVQIISQLLPVLFSFYNTAFQPILSLGPYIALGFFSTTLALIFSLIYWWLLDIERQQELKDKIEKYQEKMKESRKNDEEDEASNYMKKTMELNQKMMMLNFKPMIATMIFVALVFPWLGATFSPSVKLEKSGNGSFRGNLTYGSQKTSLKVINNSEPKVKLSGQTARIGESLKIYGTEWEVKRIGKKKGGLLSSGGGNSVKLDAKFVKLPFSIPLAGSTLNWLGFYIIIAMPLTFIFRKMLGIA